MLTVPMLNVGLNPLDVLLAGVGFRLNQLTKSDDERFLALLRNKQATIQFISDDGVARFFEFNQGNFTQKMGHADKPDLTIGFVDGMTGAKLLAKADTIALMQAIQDEQVRVEGDYKLILWFASLAKFVGKIPDQYAPYVEKITPLWQTAKPYAYKASNFATTTWGKIKHKLK